MRTVRAVLYKSEFEARGVVLSAQLASSVAARQGWQDADPLTYRLTLPAVNNQAAALKSLGALTSIQTDTELYRKSLMEILSKQPNLEELTLDERHLEESAPFDAPGVPRAAAARGRGRSGAQAGQAPPPAAAPPDPGPRELKWLTLSRTTDLVDDGATLPLEKLWTLLPGRSHDAVRRDARSLLRTNADELRSGAANATPIANPRRMSVSGVLCEP